MFLRTLKALAWAGQALGPAWAALAREIRLWVGLVWGEVVEACLVGVRRELHKALGFLIPFPFREWLMLARYFQFKLRGPVWCESFDVEGKRCLL